MNNNCFKQTKENYESQNNVHVYHCLVRHTLCRGDKKKEIVSTYTVKHFLDFLTESLTL